MTQLVTVRTLTPTAGRITYQVAEAAGPADVAGGELAAWVRDRFEAGWRRLTVTDCASGRQVGWIGLDPDTGAPAWAADDNWPE